MGAAKRKDAIRILELWTRASHKVFEKAITESEPLTARHDKRFSALIYEAKTLSEQLVRLHHRLSDYRDD